MAGILAIVAFIIAFIMQLASWSHGAFTPFAVMLLGLVFLSVHLVRDWWPGRG